MVRFVMVPIATLKMFRIVQVKCVDLTEWVALAVPVGRMRSVKLGNASRFVYPIAQGSNAVVTAVAVAAADVPVIPNAKAVPVWRSLKAVPAVQHPMAAGQSRTNSAR